MHKIEGFLGRAVLIIIAITAIWIVARQSVKPVTQEAVILPDLKSANPGTRATVKHDFNDLDALISDLEQKKKD